jgi:hypothetical protein
MKALLFTSLGFSTISSDRQKTTQLCRGPVGSSDILIRFPTHVFRAGYSTVFWESSSISRRPLKWLEKPRIKATIFGARFPID